MKGQEGMGPENSSRSGMGGKPKIAPVDVLVGRRIRVRRILMKLSQSALGEAVGVTFQQIQKYERGTNRVGASRLSAIASVLGVPISYFFEAEGGGSAESQADHAALAPMDRTTILLLQAFAAIADPVIKKRIVDLTRSIAAGVNGASHQDVDDRGRVAVESA